MVLDHYLTESELAKELKRKTGEGTPGTLRKWRREGRGPAWTWAGRSVIYPADEVEKWLRANMRQPRTTVLTPAAAEDVAA